MVVEIRNEHGYGRLRYSRGARKMSAECVCCSPGNCECKPRSDPGPGQQAYSALPAMASQAQGDGGAYLPGFQRVIDFSRALEAVPGIEFQAFSNDVG